MDISLFLRVKTQKGGETLSCACSVYQFSAQRVMSCTTWIECVCKHRATSHSHNSRGQRSFTWWARQIRSRSCLCRNLATTSEPKVNDTPLSFSPQPRTSLSGSDQSRSHSRPWSGTSVGRMMRLICSMDWRSGDSPEQKGSKSTNKHTDFTVDTYHTYMRPTAADRLKKQHYSRTNDSGWRQRLDYFGHSG